MLNYKIIASDLDGTLFNSQSRISPENYRAIKEYTQMGGFFVPSSGRTFTELTEEVKNIPGVRYILYADGAGIYDRVADQHYRENMPLEVGHMVLSVLQEYDTILSVRSRGVSYVDARRHTDRDYAPYRLSKAFVEYLQEYSKPVEDFTEFCLGLPEIEMIGVFFRTDEQQMACKKRLESTGAVKLVSSAPTNFEIVSVKAGKGCGLLRLAGMLGVTQSQTIAVGDTTNDLEQIQMAGLGLAMGNAWEPVKEVADAVICTNEEHMMPYILEHFIENK